MKVDMTTPKHTPLYQKHLDLGARMVEFASYYMPVQYSGILDEHKCVRENAGIFDVSHMGEIFVSGEDALDLLQLLVPQDVEKLSANRAVYAQLTNENGGIIDDLIIYRLADEIFLLVVNASRIKEDLAWIEQNVQREKFKVTVDNQSENFSLLALQGPKAAEIVTELGLPEEEHPEYFSFIEKNLFGHDLFISRTGYTGEDGFEIMVKNDFAPQLWDKILEAGGKYNIKPIGLGARDTLRLEAALLLYGNDMDESVTPIEAGLAWSVSKSKTHNYNGKHVIKQHLENKPAKRLVGFVMLDKAIARHGYEVYNNERQIGVVTSGGVSPTLGVNIGLAYIDDLLKIDDEISIKIRDKFFKAHITKRPFIQKVNKIVK
ncbi:MAG: glycine cleavage system aminomethyltransferase GcvT [Candidatus Gastranaerophilales bacterium]|nr:glycine cleavage system aminomethyltransferase GcvT [Candidatus Gastranaerophilales bacterium]